MKTSFLLPDSLNALWADLDTHPNAKIMAGGTDLLVFLRTRGEKTPAIICLEKISALDTIEQRDGSLYIGAATSLTNIFENELIDNHLGVLQSAIGELGSPLIRNMGTIGGNICTGSPAGDTLPALFVLRAEVVLKSRKSERILPINSFITGPGQTVLQNGEILHSIRIPVSSQFNIHHFEKVGQRKALAISIVSFAALVCTEKNIVKEARFAWGSVGPTIIESKEVEQSLLGQPLTLSMLENAANLARQAVMPISDLRASGEYRKQVAGNLLLRLVATV